MFNAKTIILAKALRPDLNFASPGAEELVWLKIASRYASGNPVRNATIENGIAYFDRVTASQPLVSLKLNLPVTQTGSGTPSPDNIRDIVGVSGVTISRTGKNLLDSSNSAIIGGNKWFYGNSNTYKFWKAGTYIFSAVFGYAGIKVLYTLQNGSQGTIITSATSGLGEASFTLPQDGYYRLFAQNSGISDDDVINPMIAISNDLTYEPYNSNTYSISFGQTVYSANLDVLRGILTVDKVYLELNGSENWINVGGAYPQAFQLDTGITNAFQGAISTQKANNNSNLYPWASYDVEQYAIRWQVSAQGGRLFVYDNNYTSDLAGFKQHLSDTHLKVVYLINTPIEIDLTPTQITTLIGENVIFADVANVTECKYTRK